MSGSASSTAFPEITDPYRLRPLQIGDKAPVFHARSTRGDINLADYRGRWVLLLSHPADFTPVCTSEFLALAGAHDNFKALNCDLLGVSIDSLYSHLGWLRAIRDHFGTIVDFPLIEDSSLAIGRAYGMISDQASDAAAMRTSFFIDPEGIIRATQCYPASVGRSVKEMLRTLAALQRVEQSNVITPEGWQPGCDILLPPAQNLSGTDSGTCWFYQTRADREE